MQFRELHWRKLIPGLLLLTGLVLTALVILVAIGLGNLPGKKFTVYALTDQARGILRGSDIWLGGQRAGIVSNVQFLPVSSAPGALTTTSPVGDETRVLIELEILTKYKHLIGRNSSAQIRSGSRFLGNPVVHVSLGIAGQPLIEEGDTLTTLKQFDAEEITAKAEAVMAMLPGIKRDLQNVVASATWLDSAITLLLPDSPANRTALAELGATLAALIDGLDRGSLGLFLNDTALTSRARSISARGNTLVALLEDRDNSLTRFLRDTALFARIDYIGNTFGSTLTALEAKLNLKSGSRADALRVELDRLAASLRALRDDARRHPFRYIVF